MDTIKEIFFKGTKTKYDNIIKPLKINWNIHSNGIIRIGNYLTENTFDYFEIKEILKNLLLYFTGNNECKYNLNKGLMFYGNVGTGKSLLFKIFKEYTMNILQSNSFQLFDMQEIISNCEINGIEELSEFGMKYPKPIYIDDFGCTNDEINHYGTKYNITEELLLMRYNVYRRFNKLTHISTNKTPEKLSKIFDIRIIDRMVEMFNLIEFSGESRRI